MLARCSWFGLCLPRSQSTSVLLFTARDRVIAFLLGLHGAAQISRYEHFRAVPGLLTALGYHVIFQTSPPALFGGKYQKVERTIRRRAKRLLRKVAKEKPNRRTERKLAWLRVLAGESELPKQL